MMPRSLAFALPVSLTLGLGLSTLACHTHEGFEPVYEGCATDENWDTLQDYETTNRVKTDANAGPKWLQPPPAATETSLPSATTPTWRWQPSASDAGTDRGNVSCEKLGTASLKVASHRLTPLHEPPVSGTVYDLQFSVDHVVSYRVLTTKQSATVPQATWASWAGKHVTVDLVSAKLLQNDVVEGPYRAALQSVLVTP